MATCVPSPQSMSRLLPLYRVINAVNFRYGNGIMPPVPSKHTSNIQIFPSFPRSVAEFETVTSTVQNRIHRYPQSDWFHLFPKNSPKSFQNEKILPDQLHSSLKSFFHNNYNIIRLLFSLAYPPCQITAHHNGMLCRFPVKILSDAAGYKAMFLIQLLRRQITLPHFQINGPSATLLRF
jgi:hypothetical protein